MTEWVKVPYGDNARDTAVLLLAAAEETGLGRDAVKTREGSFLVREEVAAKVAENDGDDDEAPKRRRRKKDEAEPDEQAQE